MRSRHRSQSQELAKILANAPSNGPLASGQRGGRETEEDTKLFTMLCTQFIFPFNLTNTAPLPKTEAASKNALMDNEVQTELLQEVEVSADLLKEEISTFLRLLSSTVLPELTSLAQIVPRQALAMTTALLKTSTVVQLHVDVLEYLHTRMRTSEQLPVELRTALESQSTTKAPPSRAVSFARVTRDASKRSTPLEHETEAEAQRRRHFSVLDTLESLRRRCHREKAFYNVALPLLIFSLRFVAHKWTLESYPCLIASPLGRPLLEEMHRDLTALLDPDGVFHKLTPLHACVKGTSLCIEQARKAHPSLRTHFRDTSHSLSAIRAAPSSDALDVEQKWILYARLHRRLRTYQHPSLPNLAAGQI